MSQNARIFWGLVTGGLIAFGVLSALHGGASMIHPDGDSDEVNDPPQPPVPFGDAVVEFSFGVGSLLLGAGLAVWLARRS